MSKPLMDTNGKTRSDDRNYMEINVSGPYEEHPLLPGRAIKRDGMLGINIAAYAVGHVYNDF